MEINEKRISEISDILTIVVGLLWIFKKIDTFYMGISLTIINISKFVLYFFTSYTKKDKEKTKSLGIEAIITMIIFISIFSFI